MKCLFAALFVSALVLSATEADAQVVAYYGPAPVFVAPPPVPVVAYYGAPVVAYTPGYYYGPAAPVVVGPRYVVRQRVYVRGQPVRNFFRVLAP